MGRMNVDAVKARSPEPGRRPKILGGPVEVRAKDAARADEIALLNLSEPSFGLLRTRLGECVYSAAPSPLEPARSEDCLIIVHGETDSFVVIADGAGGHPAGDRAARIAVTEVAAHLGRARTHGTSARNAIFDGFEAASARIMDETPGALTTLLVVEVTRRLGALQFRTYHAGDTAALVFSARGRVRWNTVLHSPVGYAVESGLVGPDEALHDEDLNLVSSLLGGPDVSVEMSAWVPLDSGETLLVATDGLLDNAYRRELGRAASLRNLEHARRRLTELVQGRMLNPSGELSKPDDCTFVLFRGSVDRAESK